MNSKNNIEAAFEKIHQIALNELKKSTLPQETKSALEDIVALSRYEFDVTNHENK